MSTAAQPVPDPNSEPETARPSALSVLRQLAGAAFQGAESALTTASALESAIITSLNAAGVETVSLREFAAAAEAAPLSRQDRLTLIDQGVILLTHLYPHLPYKQARFQADPFSALDALKALVLSTNPPSEADFHTSLLAAFNQVRDVHTSYVLPGNLFPCPGLQTQDAQVSYQGAVAFLPFRVGAYLDADGERVYVVSAISGMAVEGFEVGSTLLSWNGQSMDAATAAASRLRQGDSDEVNYARGVQRLTVRPVSTNGIRLGELYVRIEYLPPPADNVVAQEKKVVTLPWLIGTKLGVLNTIPSAAFSMNPDQQTAYSASEALYCRADPGTGMYSTSAAPDPALLPGTFSFTFTGGPEGDDLNPSALQPSAPGSAVRPDARFGYIRIKSFLSPASDPATSLVDAFQQILVMMETSAPDGLILDIRGNTGGAIEGAERMLQMLTPRRIEPSLFHLALTPQVVEILRAVGPSQDSQLNRWAADTLAGLKTADGHLSIGKPLTNPSQANEIGQIYHGPVVLLIDGLTYSAGDIFAAGFQDNEIGKVIGTDSRTGGGGASVWRHDELLQRLPPNNLGLAPLPGKAVIGLAILRTSRVGRNRNDLEPVPIEDVGVSIDHPDLLHRPTLRDVLAESTDLLGFACDQLAAMPVHRIGGISLPLPPRDEDDPDPPSALNPRFDGKAVQLTVQTTGLDSIDILLNEKPAMMNVAVSDGASLDLTLPVARPPARMRILGYQRAGGPPGGGDTPLAIRNFVFPVSKGLSQALAQAAASQFTDFGI